MVAFIEKLKDDTCTPKPAKLNAWVYIIHTVHLIYAIVILEKSMCVGLSGLSLESWDTICSCARSTPHVCSTPAAPKSSVAQVLDVGEEAGKRSRETSLKIVVPSGNLT